MTRQRAVLLILLTWTIALLFATIPLAWLSTIVQQSLLFVHNSVSCVLVVITYYRIYTKVRRAASKHSSSFMNRCDAAKEEAAVQRQATRTVFIVVFFFVVCWGPWTVVSFMMAIKEQLVDDVGAVYRGKTLRIVQSCCLTLGFMSSAVNVFV